jgi:hypothetical protein
MKSLIIVLLFISTISISIHAQVKPYPAFYDVRKELLLELKKGMSLEFILNQFSELDNGVVLDRKLMEDQPVYNVITSSPELAQKIINRFNNHPGIIDLSQNVPVSSRGLRPNDEFFFEQYPLTLMNMPDLWEDGISGVTAEGDTIVVAVVESDDNYFLHEDLVDNLWRNHLEIPNDNIDNDNNGYVDDFYGINALSGRGTNLEAGPSSHGLGVSGIVGAKSDNGFLLSGMTWNVKILQIDNIRGRNQAIAAYDYIYQLRKKYNDSNGSEGAFIVAANSSFGNDNFSETETQWCSMYDKMAEEGIISFGAVRNDDVNIDEEGDIPGTCPQDGLVTVGNINRMDEIEDSGFSKVNLDLVTYGVLLPVLSELNEKSTLTGTSFSTPHLTGLTALLYGQACREFIELSKNDPIEAVELMKNWILSKAKPISSQEGRSITEGKLDPRGTQQLLFDYCNISNGLELEIDRIFQLNEESILLDYFTNTPGDSRLKIINSLGQVVQDAEFQVRLEDPFTYVFKMSNVPAGVYYLQLMKEGKEDTQAFFYQP